MTTANALSVPIPENAERRAVIAREIQTATGLDEAVLERLVRDFYDTARRDDVIGYLFDGVRDWEEHITTITAFWSSVALLTGRYHGQPLAPHVLLPLEPVHFARWLMLFERTARTVCPQAGAEYLLEKANRIAGSLQMGVGFSCGEVPRAGGRS